MANRPAFIKFTAYFLFATAGIDLTNIANILNNPMTRELIANSSLALFVMNVMYFLSPLVSIVSGIAILKGRSWARFLYVGYTGIGFVFRVIVSIIDMIWIPRIVVFVVIIFFLFRPKANEYFSVKTKSL
jgi:hypothetical protein